MTVMSHLFSIFLSLLLKHCLFYLAVIPHSTYKGGTIMIGSPKFLKLLELEVWDKRSLDEVSEFIWRAAARFWKPGAEVSSSPRAADAFSFLMEY